MVLSCHSRSWRRRFKVKVKQNTYPERSINKNQPPLYGRLCCSYRHFSPTYLESASEQFCGAGRQRLFIFILFHEETKSQGQWSYLLKVARSPQSFKTGKDEQSDGSTLLFSVLCSWQTLTIDPRAIYHRAWMLNAVYSKPLLIDKSWPARWNPHQCQVPTKALAWPETGCLRREETWLRLPSRSVGQTLPFPIIFFCSLW